jgi:hypothetical protein
MRRCTSDTPRGCADMRPTTERERATTEGMAGSGWTAAPPGDGTPREPRRARPRAGTWSAYAACAWALLFSLQSFYYAAGGTAGAATWPPAIATGVLERRPGWVATMWATGALKVLVGVLALALVRPWGRAIPRWLLLTAAWSATAIMAVYEGAASLIQHALMVAGVITTPEGLGERSARWHLFLWDPWWLIGGALLGVAAWGYRRWSHRRADEPRAVRRQRVQRNG